MNHVIVLSWENLLFLAKLWVVLSKIPEKGLTEFFTGVDKMDQLQGSEFHITTNSQSNLVIRWEELNRIRLFLIDVAKPETSSSAVSQLLRQLTDSPGTERDSEVMTLAFHLMSVTVS